MRWTTRVSWWRVWGVSAPGSNSRSGKPPLPAVLGCIISASCWRVWGGNAPESSSRSGKPLPCGESVGIEIESFQIRVDCVCPHLSHCKAEGAAAMDTAFAPFCGASPPCALQAQVHAQSHLYGKSAARLALSVMSCEAGAWLDFSGIHRRQATSFSMVLRCYTRHAVR